MKSILILLLALLTAAPAAPYTWPSDLKLSFTPGVDVGVPDGIGQYADQSGDADERNTADGINVTLAPYYVNPASPTTTGTISAGSSTITVVSATGFRVNDVVKIVAPYPEQAQLVVTAAPSANGDVKINIGDASFTNPLYSVAVLSTDTINQVAAKIRAASFTDWATGGTGDTVTFTSTAITNIYYDLSLPSGSVAGFAGTATTPTQGNTTSAHSVTSISGNDIGLTPARSSALGATGAVFKVDSTASINAAINAATAGQVVYLPTGTYLIDSTISIGHTRDEITIRGDGPGLTIIKPDPSVTSLQNMMSIGTNYSYSEGTLTPVTAGKTLFSTALTVASSAGFSVGEVINIGIESDYDNARIQAGKAVVIEVFGDSFPLTHLARITSIAGNVLNIHPGLPIDGTYGDVLVRQKSDPAIQTSLIGLEDLTIDGDENTGIQNGLSIDQTDRTWISNIQIKGYSNYGIYMNETYKNELRHSIIGPGRAAGTNSAGIIVGRHCASLIEDNIVKRNSSTVQENAGAMGNAWLYNLFAENTSGNDVLLNHGPHNIQNLYEGNIGHSWKADGYFGGASHYIMLRNWFHGSTDTGTINSFSMAANRWTRNFALVGNVVGWDGVSNGQRVYGNPNIGNYNAIGFAGPTGLSDQVGETDVSQPGYGVDEYIIQAGDIAAGDFWDEFGANGYQPGTMKVGGRTSDSVAVVTMADIASLAVGDGNYNNGPSIWWGGHTAYRKKMEVIAVSGNDVTFGVSGYEEGVAMPAEGTVVEVWFGQGKYQQRDLDVRASFTEVHQYISNAAGTGAIENSTVDTLPDSLSYTAKPAWFGSLTWPPVNPNSPTFSLEIIPAGYRYVNDSAPAPDPSGPTITTGSLSIGGTLSIGN